jgi:hypothetical protein
MVVSLRYRGQVSGIGAKSQVQWSGHSYSGKVSGQVKGIVVRSQVQCSGITCSGQVSGGVVRSEV